jgi:hypothetical protein
MKLLTYQPSELRKAIEVTCESCGCIATYLANHRSVNQSNLARDAAMYHATTHRVRTTVRYIDIDSNWRVMARYDGFPDVGGNQ